MEDNLYPDELRVKGRLSRGYGVVPKLIMESNLKIESKAIYSYFCSFAGSGTVAFPGKNKILKDLDISDKRYYKFFNPLVEAGLIEVEQKRGSGKFDKNIYTLIENIDTDKLTPEKLTAAVNVVENAGDSPYGQFDSTGQIAPYGQIDHTAPYSQIAYTQFDHTNNNNINNNNNIDIINNQSSQSVSEEKQNNFSTIIDDDNDDDVTKIKKIIHRNISYDDDLKKVLNKTEFEIADELVLCMIDVICGTGKYVNISGEEKLREIVKQRYMSINSEDIIHLIENLSKQTKKINNISAYLRTALYQVKQEKSFYYTNLERVISGS